MYTRICTQRSSETIVTMNIAATQIPLLNPCSRYGYEFIFDSNSRLAKRFHGCIEHPVLVTPAKFRKFRNACATNSASLSPVPKAVWCISNGWRSVESSEHTRSRSMCCSTVLHYFYFSASLPAVTDKPPILRRPFHFLTRDRLTGSILFC